MERMPNYHSLESFSRREDAKVERDLTVQRIRAERRARDDSEREQQVIQARLDALKEYSGLMEAGRRLRAEERQHQIEQLTERLKTLAVTLEEIDTFPLVDDVSGNEHMIRYRAHMQAQADAYRRSLSTFQASMDNIDVFDAAIAQASVEERDFEEKLARKATDKEVYQRAARRHLEDFYRHQLSQWQQMPVEIEEMRPYFDERFLARLTMQQYAFLLQRFPSALVTHVTRQGVRDHTGHPWHTLGEGKFHNNFLDIIQDGRLRSRIGSWLKDGAKQEAVLDIFGGSEMLKEVPVDQLSACFNRLFEMQPADEEYSGTYSDFTAVHVAAQEVADAYYGGETGNEIFFCFPSAHIAAQHHFAGQLTQKSVDKSGSDWNKMLNDQWIWSEEHRGISINAGIVFIAKNARVSRETGSQYQLDVNHLPVVDEELRNRVMDIFEDPEYERLMQEYYRLDSNFDGHLDEDAVSRVKHDILSFVGDKYEVTDPIILRDLTDSLLASKYDSRWPLENKRALINMLEKRPFYRRNNDTISSQEYWEAYFRQYPDQRPARIFYYESSPSEALDEWRKAYGLSSYDEARVSTAAETVPKVSLNTYTLKKNAEAASRGIEHFRALAVRAMEVLH